MVQSHNKTRLSNSHKNSTRFSLLIDTLSAFPAMSKLIDFRLSSFDVYGTLIDWETGILNGLKPLYQRVNLERGQALKVYHELEMEQQTKTPNMPYSQLLTAIYPQFASKLGLEGPTAEESEILVDQWATGQPSLTRLTPSGGFRSTTHYSFSSTSTTSPFPLAQPVRWMDSGSTRSSQRRMSGPTSRTLGTSNTC